MIHEEYEHQGSKFLYLSGESYSKILEHFGRNERERKRVEKEEAHKKYLKEQSNAMEEKWTNSIKNIQHREKERRKMKQHLLEEKEKHKMDILEEVREYEKQQRKKYLDELKKKLRMKSEPNYVLSKALLGSEIIAENALFVKFKKEKQKEENEREAEWIKSTLQNMKNLIKEEEEEKCKIRYKNKLLRADQLKQIQEKQKNDMENKIHTLHQEQEDLKRMRSDLEKTRDEELEDYKNRVMAMKKYMREHRQNKDISNRSIQNSNKELDEVCRIYNDFSTKRRCGIELQKKEEWKKASETQNRMGLSNKQVDDDIEKKQNDVIKKYLEEMEQKHQEAEKQEIERNERMKKELIDYQSQFMNEKKEQERERSHKLRFDMAQRLKYTEQLQQYEEEKKKKIRCSEVVSNGLPTTSLPTKSTKSAKSEYEIQDEKFFSYAREVLEYARKRGINDLPIRKEINKYCKDNQLPLYPDCLKTKTDLPPETIKSSVKIQKI